MNMIAKKAKSFLQFSLVLCCFLFAGINAHAQFASENDPRVKEMVTAMDNSANEWNLGHLDNYISLYDSSATMMFPKGPVGMDGIKGLYEKSYFKDGMPKQKLRYTNIKVRFLGKKYALLTGGFTLYGKELPERSGTYSLVMIRTKGGWKILHDHSS